MNKREVRNIEIPENYDEALLTANKEDWQCAVLEEHQSLIDNDAYEEVEKCTQTRDGYSPLKLMNMVYQQSLKHV